MTVEDSNCESASDVRGITTVDINRRRHHAAAHDRGSGIRGNSGQILELNPFRCKIWALHDRLSDYVTEESCRAEIESISRHGQLVPVLGRPLSNNHDFDVEIIYGARRLFVAQHLNISLRAEVRQMSDREAIIAMDTENRHRKDISPYERGLSFARWLRTGYFTSQDDVARNLKISPSQVSRLLKLTKLPAVIVGAFNCPSDIREGWGLDLVELWEHNSKRALIAQRARMISNRVPRLSAEEVFRSLTAPLGSFGRERKSRRDIVVRAENGSPLFRLRHLRNDLALLLPHTGMSDGAVKRVCAAVAEVLRSGTAS